MSAPSQELTRIQLIRMQKSYGFVAGILIGAISQFALHYIILIFEGVVEVIFGSQILESSLSILINYNSLWFIGMCIIGGFVGTVNSISRERAYQFRLSQNELQESKEKYEMLVEKLEEGVVLEDSEGKISFANPKIVQLVGYSEEELLGKHWSYVIPEECLAQIQNEVNKRSKGISSIYETYVRAKNGQYIPVIVTATPLFSKNGSFEGVLTVITDITEQAKLKELRERFIASTSHELRTPVTVIKGYIDFLKKNSDLPSNKVNYIYTKLQSNINRLSGLIDNVHALSQVEQNIFKISKTETNLNDLVQNIQEQNSIIYPKKPIMINYFPSSNDSSFIMDQERILQVLHNLISNAVKNSPERSIIEVSIVKEDGNVKITVQDYGDGIVIHQLFKLFQPFAHSDTKYSSTGTGLGLYIVKFIVLAHGGTIEVFSQEGYGTCFTIIL